MMKAYAALAIIAMAFALAPGTSAQDREAPPAWAYPVNPPDLKLPPDDGTPRRVPGSSVTYTLTQVRDRHFSPVWHPQEHPPQPEVVARGRKPDVPACGFCHRADGPGGPENANLAGLPAAYIIQQAADFKSGARKTSVPKRNIDQKPGMFQAATDAEVEAAAAYFSALKPRTIIKVVETDTVPRTYITANHLAADKTGETEPIGRRIIEVPEDLEQFVSRDTQLRFHRIRSGGECSGRAGAGHHRWWGQNSSVRDLSRPGTERAGPHPRDCRPLDELYRAPALRLQVRSSSGCRKRPHEALR